MESGGKFCIAVHGIFDHQVRMNSLYGYRKNNNIYIYIYIFEWAASFNG